MGLDERDLPEGVDFPDAAYQTGVRSVAPKDVSTTLPKSREPIPQDRGSLLQMLDSFEAREAAKSREVMELSLNLRDAIAERNVAYDERQDIRQDIRVLRMRLRDTMPMEFPKDPEVPQIPVHQEDR